MQSMATVLSVVQTVNHITTQATQSIFDRAYTQDNKFIHFHYNMYKTEKYGKCD